MNKKKVLLINISSDNSGGVERFLFNMFKNIDKDNFEFCFAPPSKIPFEQYEKEILDLGGEIFSLEENRKSFLSKMRYNYKLYRFVKTNNFDIVHVNSGVFLFCLQVSIIAKICNVKRIIVHSHNSNNSKGIKKVIIAILKPFLDYISTDKLACSNDAAISMFSKDILKSKKYKVVKNGIDIEEYAFNEEKRKIIRQLNDLVNKKVYINVAAFNYQKNHSFLIDVFYEIFKKQNNSVLLLIGKGQLKEIIEQKVIDLGLQKNVVFMGERSDVNDLLSASDYFLLPSIYEGLPIVAIEAQTNGLPVVCSNTVPFETKISDDVFFLDSKDSPEEWANMIIGVLANDDKNREKRYLNTLKNGYDVKSLAKQMFEIYMEASS